MDRSPAPTSMPTGGDAAVAPAAPGTPCLRVAFVGKGGTGKSTLAGALARTLARRGLPVLAVDSDPMPGLAHAIGVGAADDVGVASDAVEELTDDDGRTDHQLRAGLSAEQAVDRCAAIGPDGVRFLQIGKASAGHRPDAAAQRAFRLILAALPDDGWQVVGDLPGGTRQPFFGWSDYARTVVVVVEPTATSMLSARRLARLARGGSGPERIVAVASKVRDRDDTRAVACRTGIPVVGAVPLDGAVGDAERRGVPLVDLAPRCPAVRAVAELADTLLAAKPMMGGVP